jgi:hypothetical protein
LGPVEEYSRKTFCCNSIYLCRQIWNLPRNRNAGILAIYLLQIQLTCIFEHFEYFFIFLLISVLYLNLIFQLFGIILQKYKCISVEAFLGGICFHVAALLIFWNTFPLMMAEKTAEMSWQMEYSIFIVKYNKRFYLYVSSSDNKSASHWIMFDYFFHVWKVNIFFLIMFLIYSCSHV